MCPLGWRETPTALFLPSQFHLHEMPASSSSSTHISPQFNRRPNRSSISLAEEEQGKRLEIIYWLDHAHSIMRTKEDPKKAPKYLVTLKEPGVKYRECRKNHAASIGGYAVDGCREFMAAGKEGTSAALKCAACSCHRSFHKREVEIDGLCDCSSISNSTSTPRK